MRKKVANNGIFHDSGIKSLTGEAQYIDDLSLEKNAWAIAPPKKSINAM